MHKDFIHLVPMTFIRVLISEQIRSPQLICICVQWMRLTGDLYQDSHCLVTRLSRSFIPCNRFNHPSRFVARLRLKAIFNIVFFYPILSHSILLGTGWTLLKYWYLVTDKYLVWLHFSLRIRIYTYILILGINTWSTRVDLGIISNYLNTEDLIDLNFKKLEDTIAKIIFANIETFLLRYLITSCNTSSKKRVYTYQIKDEICPLSIDESHN